MSKTRQVEGTVLIYASKEEVWDLLVNRFGEINIFNPMISGSHYVAGPLGLVGCERICQMPNGKHIRERITKISGHDCFEVDIIEGGLPMLSEMKATFQLKERNEELIEVRMTIKYVSRPRFLWFLIKSSLQNAIFKLLSGLKYNLETGNVIDAENIKEAVRLRKLSKLDLRFRTDMRTIPSL